MKDQIESDVVKVQEAITTRLVDRNELDTLKTFYEEKLLGIKNQFDAQLEMNRQLAEINEYLGRQVIKDITSDKNLTKNIKSPFISAIRINHVLLEITY
jgi:hypothetical protein